MPERPDADPSDAARPDAARPDADAYDVVVVGGGPAGLSAALSLGRSCRRVLVASAGRPRNLVTEAAHNVFTRDGTPPPELLRIGREQLDPYDVALREARVLDAEGEDGRFRLRLQSPEGGTALVAARKIVLAIGVDDHLPSIPGLDALWGGSVFHCPYCHGWEVAGEPIGVYASGEVGFVFARKMLGWSRDVVLFTDGPAGLDPSQAGRLADLGVEIREESISRLVVDSAGALEAVALDGGDVVSRRALFVHHDTAPRTDLAERLGCEIDEDRRVDADEFGKTTVPGVYVAGDAGPNAEQVIVAAASGATAAAAVNEELLEEDFGA